jgi:hypothetical protein
MPTNLSHKNHPTGRPWKAQIARRIKMSNGVTKVKCTYLGYWETEEQALAAEEAYVKANKPMLGTWRFVWNEETKTMEVFTRNG